MPTDVSMNLQSYAVAMALPSAMKEIKQVVNFSLSLSWISARLLCVQVNQIKLRRLVKLLGG